MKVYLVEEGEDFEGSTVIATFSSESEVYKFASQYAETMPFEMRRCGIHLWRGGCDYLRIMTHEVYSSAEEALEDINN